MQEMDRIGGVLRLDSAVDRQIFSQTETGVTQSVGKALTNIFKSWI